VRAVSFAAFEAACVVVVVLTLVTMARARGARPLLREYGALAVAGFVGEQTCISAYRFYGYAAGWHLRAIDVPILVPLIWPLVILSAREVAAALGCTGRWRTALVAALVVFDASLVEVVAVRAGLWAWSEPGHLAVPLVGILGWGYFAAGADVALGRGQPWLAIVLGPAAAHGLILASWWGLFRWTLRGDLGHASTVGMVAASALVLFAALGARKNGRAIPLSVASPRMIAAALFVVLLLTTAPRDVPLWIHTACVAIPYFAATSLRGAALRPANA
jgi:hypothetical protein